MDDDLTRRSVSGRRENLRDVETPEVIEHLALSGAGIRSLDGIERMTALTEIRGEGLRDLDLRPLGLNRSIREVALIGCRGLQGYEALADMALDDLAILVKSAAEARVIAALPFERMALAWLELTLEAGDDATVPVDVGWVAGSTRLRSLTVLGFVPTDRSWDAIKSSQLGVLSASVAPTVDEGALYDELVEALPGAWIQLYPTVEWQGRIVELPDGSFEVGYDLAGRWDLPTTEAALGRLSAVVAEHEPSLADEMRADDEGSAVHIAAPTRGAIERIVALIERDGLSEAS